MTWFLGVEGGQRADKNGHYKQCRSSLCIIDNNKELVMRKMWVKVINVLFLDEKRPQIFRQEGNNDSTLAKIDLCSLSTKCF